MRWIPLLAALTIPLLAQKPALDRRDLEIQRLPGKIDLSQKVEIPRGYALVVGVGKYQKLREGDWLRFSESDARSVYEVLIAKEGGNMPPENVQMLVGEKATLANVRKAIEEWLPSVAQPQDRVIVYFAGHGFVYGSRGYLAPYDFDPEAVQSSGYPMDQLGKVLANQVKARWKVLLTDACHSGKITPETTDEAVYGEFAKMPNTFLTLTAAREQESSYEDPKLGTGFGLYSYYLTQGWQGNADLTPRDGVITADELVEYVRRNVRTYARQRGHSQTPTERGDFDPEMILGYSHERRMAAAGETNEPLPDGSLVVEVNMDGVEVYVDDQLVGTVDKAKPLSLPGLSSGPHTVKGVKMGYAPDTKEVLVVPGQQKTVSLRIQYARTPKRSAVGLYEKGMAIYGKRKSDDDLARARDLFAQALREDSTYSPAALQLCLTAQIIGETDEARKACKKAVDTDPDFVEARIHYGALLFETGDTDEAVRQLTTATRQDPKSSLAHSHLAQAYRMTESYARGVEAATRAIELDPSNAQAYLWRADNLRVEGKFAEAKPDYEEYLKINSFTASFGSKLAFYLIGSGITKTNASQKRVYATQRNIALFGLCECEQRLKNFTRASRFCEEALKYDTDDPFSYFVLGKIYSQLFNRDKRRDDLVTARRYYAKVVEINPAMKEAQESSQYITQIDRILPKVP
ncbi:MAG: tetratricopeptide repeat protein [Bryobacterales bacterium]|nr:tetratricopeptide repeat protein [Bryobacterales bacterium]